MLEWYNRWVKENTIVIEGLNHLQEHRLIENIEQIIVVNLPMQWVHS